jgi:hypothetical protein
MGAKRFLTIFIILNYEICYINLGSFFWTVSKHFNIMGYCHVKTNLEVTYIRKVTIRTVLL